MLTKNQLKPFADKYNRNLGLVEKDYIQNLYLLEIYRQTHDLVLKAALL